jgi:hypothetical protein
MRIKNQKDFWAGVMFVAFGAFFAGFGTQYAFGSAARMGPGYFPTVLGLIVIVLGIIVAIGGLSPGAAEEKVARFDWQTLLLVLGPIVLFGLLLNPLGLVVSLFVLVAISSYASHEFKWREALINAVVLIALCLIIFVWALKLQFPLWPSFIAG